MSYYLQYEPNLRKRYPTIADKRRRIVRILVFFTALAVTGVIFRNHIADFLIPGDPDITVPAFAEMVDKIGAGESVGESFIEFCRQIISGSVVYAG